MIQRGIRNNSGVFFFDLSMSFKLLFFMSKFKEKGGDSIAESMATVPETVSVISNVVYQKLTEKKEKNYERIYYDNRNY